MSKSYISLVHQINPSNAQHSALALAEANFLKEVITPVAHNLESPIWWYLNLLPKNVHSYIANELNRRSWLDLNSVPIITYPWQEIIRILLLRTKLDKYSGFSHSQLGDWVNISLDVQVSKHHLKGLSAIYAYEDVAANTFEKAKQEGILCLYDLPITFYKMTQRIMSEEAERFPDLAIAIESLQDPAWKLERKEQEVKLADHIFVASSVTKQSLLDIGVALEKISVIPYGAPVETFQVQRKADDNFRALYVGRVSPAKEFIISCKLGKI